MRLTCLKIKSDHRWVLAFLSLSIARFLILKMRFAVESQPVGVPQNWRREAISSLLESSRFWKNSFGVNPSFLIKSQIFIVRCWEASSGLVVLTVTSGTWFSIFKFTSPRSGSICESILLRIWFWCSSQQECSGQQVTIVQVFYSSHVSIKSQSSLVDQYPSIPLTTFSHDWSHNFELKGSQGLTLHTLLVCVTRSIQNSKSSFFEVKGNFLFWSQHQKLNGEKDGRDSRQKHNRTTENSINWYGKVIIRTRLPHQKAIVLVTNELDITYKSPCSLRLAQETCGT